MAASVVFNKFRGLESATINSFRSRHFSWMLAAENGFLKGIVCENLTLLAGSLSLLISDSNNAGQRL